MIEEVSARRIVLSRRRKRRDIGAEQFLKGVKAKPAEDSIQVSQFSVDACQGVGRDPFNSRKIRKRVYIMLRERPESGCDHLPQTVLASACALIMLTGFFDSGTDSGTK